MWASFCLIASAACIVSCSALPAAAGPENAGSSVEASLLLREAERRVLRETSCLNGGFCPKRRILKETDDFEVVCRMPRTPTDVDGFTPEGVPGANESSVPITSYSELQNTCAEPLGLANSNAYDSDENGGCICRMSSHYGEPRNFGVYAACQSCYDSCIYNRNGKCTQIERVCTKMDTGNGDMSQRCIPIKETTPDEDNVITATLAYGEWAHFHYVVDTFEDVNRESGSRLRIEAQPCQGSVSLFAKPQMLLNSRPMDQMFEVVPGTNGQQRTKTWPFPDENTGKNPQGPRSEIVEKISPGQDYPGDMFKESIWGFSSENFGKSNMITTKLVHGGYFISVVGNDCDRDTTFTISVSIEKITPEDDIKKAQDTLRKTSLKVADVEDSRGRWLMVEWLTPNVTLVSPPDDRSYMIDLASLDEYQVYWTKDSSIFFNSSDLDEDNTNVMLPNVQGPIPNPELANISGYCPLAEPVSRKCNATVSADLIATVPGHLTNSTNVMVNAVEDAIPELDTACIMDTQCGLEKNGVPYFQKLLKQPGLPGFALKRQVCPDIDKKNERGIPLYSAEDCTYSEEEPDLSNGGFVRYEYAVSSVADPDAAGFDDECSISTFTVYGKQKRKAIMCKPGLECRPQVEGALGAMQCRKKYLSLKHMNPNTAQLFIRTKAPHRCWVTGGNYCRKGTKVTKAPPVDLRVEVRLVSNIPVKLRIPSIDPKITYRSLKEVIFTVWKAHGIATVQEGMTMTDLLEIQARTEVEVTTAVSGVGGRTSYKLPIPLPCSEPFMCSDYNFRSRNLKINVVRRRCAEAGYDKDGVVKCSKFHKISEQFSTNMGNTTFDMKPPPGDDIVLIVAGAIGGVIALLLSSILFLRLKTIIRLKKAYSHAEKNLDGIPKAICPVEGKDYLKKRKNDEKDQKYKKKLWKLKFDRSVKNTEKKKKLAQLKSKKINKEAEKKAKKLKKLLEKQERERRLHERESIRLQKKAKEKIAKMKAASKAAEKKADEKARKKFLRDAEER